MNKKQTFLALVLMLVLGTVMGRVLDDFIVSSLDTDIGALLLVTFCPLVGSCLILINPLAGLFFTLGMLAGLTTLLHFMAAVVISIIIAICVGAAKGLPKLARTKKRPVCG